MSYSDDIRTIAKTKEIEEKLAKVVKDTDDLKKAAITASRTAASQTGDNSKNIQTGAPNGDDPIAVLFPDGSTSIIPPVGTSSNPPSNSTNTYESDYQTQLNLNNAIDRLNGGGGAGGITNLSGNASSGSNIGGSALASLVKGAADDAVLTSLLDKATALGYSDTAKAALAAAYLADKYLHEGTKTADEIANENQTNPQLNPQTPNNYPGTKLGAEVYNAIAGYDKDGAISGETGDVLIVKAMLNGLFPTPTEADSTAAGQLIWTTPDDPPFKSGWEEFQQGYYWSVSSPSPGEGAAPRLAIDAGIAAIIAAFPSPYPIGYGDAYWEPSSLTASGVNYDFTWYQGPGASPNTVLCTRNVCDGPHAAICPMTPNPDVESAWPKTGTYILNLVDGIWIGNQYDSEKPAIYNYPTSSVRMMVSPTDNRFIDVDLGVKGGYTISLIDTDGTTFIEGKYLNADRTVAAEGLTQAQLQFYKPR